MLALAETLVMLTVEGDLSRGRLGQPVSVAPDIVQRITAELDLALVHSRYAITHMRASAGGGFCVYGSVVCDQRYDNTGAQARYRIAPWLVAIGGLHLTDLDEPDGVVELAARLEHARGRVTVHATPVVLIPDEWWLPVGADLRVVGDLVVNVTAGATAPLDAPGDWVLPLAGSLAYTFHRAFGAGISFAWPRLTGGQDQPSFRAPIHGTDYRVVQIWFTSTW